MKPARIIVLAIAVVAGGAAALLAGRSESPPPAPPPVAQLETTDVLVAANNLSPGTKLAAADLRWQTWPAAGASDGFVRKSEHPEALNRLAGATTRATFSAGEPIRESKLIQANGSGYLAAILPAGKRAVAVEVSPESGAGGFILPNDHVDVMLARKARSTDKDGKTIEVPTSEILLSNVPVLAIDQTVEEKAGARVVVGKTATLELTAGQAQRVAEARQSGQLSLALRSVVDFNKPVALEDEKPAAPPAWTINVYRGTDRTSLTCTPLCNSAD